MMATMNKKLLAFTCFALCLFIGFDALCASKKATKAKAPAPAPVNIVATVGPDAISDYDLAMRIRFVMESSSIPDTEENRADFRNQILDMMIDELLKKQEAKRSGIENTATEIDDAIGRIEAQNNLAPGDLKKQLQNMGVTYDTLRSQVDADLLWLKYVHRVLWGSVNISDAEVKEKLAEYSSAADKTAYNISEIFLPVSDYTKDAEVYKTALDILKALEEGSDFPSLARQFSESASAEKGGDMGWVTEGSLDKSLEDGIALLSAGQISLPIKTSAGYHIILLKDKRLSSTAKQFELAKVTVPASYKEKNPEFITELLAQKTCPSFIELGKKASSEGSGSLGVSLLSALPDSIKELLENVKEGAISAPLSSDEKDIFFMVCKDLTGKSDNLAVPSADKVKQMLEAAKADMLSRRKLRELRRNTIIEKRS